LFWLCCGVGVYEGEGRGLFWVGGDDANRSARPLRRQKDRERCLVIKISSRGEYFEKEFYWDVFRDSLFFGGVFGLNRARRKFQCGAIGGYTSWRFRVKDPPFKAWGKSFGLRDASESG